MLNLHMCILHNTNLNYVNYIVIFIINQVFNNISFVLSILFQTYTNMNFASAHYTWF